MHPSIKIEVIEGVTVIRLLGRLPHADLLAVMSEITRTHQSNHRLWQLTDHFAYTTEEVRQIAAHGRAINAAPARVALVAGDDLSFGLLRMLGVFGEEADYAMKVFREQAPAMEWLLSWTP